MGGKGSCYRTLSLSRTARLLHQTSPPARGTWSAQATKDEKNIFLYHMVDGEGLMQERRKKRKMKTNLEKDRC